MDISGQRFGLLKAIEPTGEVKGTSVVWRCECQCGNVVEVTAAALRRRLSPRDRAAAFDSPQPAIT